MRFKHTFTGKTTGILLKTKICSHREGNTNLLVKN